MLGRTASLTIRTPEGVTFDLPLAGPVSRCMSLAIDVAVVVVLTSAVQITLGIVGGAAFADMTAGLMILAQFIIWSLYGIVTEWLWRGQTVGKRAVGLQVVDERGLNLTLKQIVIRNVMRAVDSMPPKFYMVGGSSCFFSRRCQRLGDIAAGTVVIRKVKVNEPDLQELIPPEENSFRQSPLLEGRLKQAISPEEARIALDAVVRRDQLEPDHRLVLFSELADHFRSQAEYPDELITGLSDEQLVRNVVETLFRSSAAQKKDAEKD